MARVGGALLVVVTGRAGEGGGLGRIGVAATAVGRAVRAADVDGEGLQGVVGARERARVAGRVAAEARLRVVGEASDALVTRGRCCLLVLVAADARELLEGREAPV